MQAPQPIDSKTIFNETARSSLHHIGGSLRRVRSPTLLFIVQILSYMLDNTTRRAPRQRIFAKFNIHAIEYALIVNKITEPAAGTAALL